ncbi:MAG: hypothetical protein NZM26_01865 [Patescibacteria group bacterium]|nr:hypothetical protein [Patescibacteria group bacterium]
MGKEVDLRKQQQAYTKVIKRIPISEDPNSIVHAFSPDAIFQRYGIEEARSLGVTRKNLASEVLNPANCIKHPPTNSKLYVRLEPSNEMCSSCPFSQGCVIRDKNNEKFGQ